MLSLIFFFVNRSTAYDIRLVDWRSDVCSSDLYTASRAHSQAVSETAAAAPPRANVPSKSPLTRRSRSRDNSYREEHRLAFSLEVDVEPIGREACRARVCQ